MLAKQSNAPVTKLWLVRAELGLGLCDRALRTTREVIKGHPNITKAYVLRGQALLLAADFDQATKHLREALRLDPDDVEGARTMKKVMIECMLIECMLIECMLVDCMLVDCMVSVPHGWRLGVHAECD